jgi:tight adherence protein B
VWGFFLLALPEGCWGGHRVCDPSGLCQFSEFAKRKKQFETQLIDALMIMSSSFRGALSPIQSMEAVVEEMNDPIRQEFGIVLGENKMGVSFDDALYLLYKGCLPRPCSR